MDFGTSKFALKDWLLLLGITVSYTIILFVVANNCFFWDTVQLGSKHAHYFYTHHFGNVLLPDSMDSGHVPLFGAYVALCWSLFGKSLPVSHFCMLPFLIGIAYESIHLLKKWIAPQYIIQATLIVLIEPTLLAQSTLVSPDVVLIFALLFSVNAVLDKNNLYLAMGITLLMLVSMRGVMVTAALLCFQMVEIYSKPKRNKLMLEVVKILPAYLPGIVLFTTYQSFHFLEKGWAFYHENSPWAPSFEKAGLREIFKNLLFLFHRMLDFGRIFIFGTIFFLVIKFRSKVVKDATFQMLLLLFSLLLGFLSYSFLFYKGLTGHRYLLPVYVVSLLIAMYLITKYSSKPYRWLTLAAVALVTGHFWVYPGQISQGWDSSLAHYPYFGLRNKMNQYMKSHQIPFNQVIAAFPNLASQEDLELNGSTDAHIALESGQPKKYLLHSNVYNDMKNGAGYDSLIKHSMAVYSLQSCNVNMTLYIINQ